MIELLNPSEHAATLPSTRHAQLSNVSADQSNPTFKQRLDIAIEQQEPLPQGVTQEARDKAVKAAQDLVSVALVQPVLKHMREANKAAPPFGPGKGERMFRSMMDADIAHGLVSSGRWELVNAVARKLLNKTSSAGHGGANPAATEQEAQVKTVQTTSPLSSTRGTDQG